MNESIAFPNLNLYFEHVGRSFHVFGIEITYYGVTLAIGMMLGIAFAFREAKRVGLDPDRFFNMALIAVVAGIIGARVYYVAFRWDYYRDHLMEIFNYRQGGIAVYGSIIGAMIAIVIYTRVKRMSFRLVTDTCCMGLLIGQFIGRWGNFFNREAFGGYTDGLFAMRLPINAVRSGDISAASYRCIPLFCMNLSGIWACFVCCSFSESINGLTDSCFCCTCWDMALDGSGSRDFAQISF